MHLEIEIQSPVAKGDIYELRNYLVEHLDGVSLLIKEAPPQEGQMVLGLVLGAIVTGSIEGAIGISVNQMYDRILKPKIDEWLKTKNANGNRNMEVLSTLKTEDTKVHFLENGSGETKVFDNVNYAIDTDRTFAVLIGSGEFESHFPSIPPVKGNLEDFYQLLTDKLHIGLPPENVAIAHNKTNTEVEELLLQNSRRQNMETLIIYYAGHGHRTDVKKLYLIARNTKKIDDYILGGIDFDFISNAVMKPSSARQKILILDACHSGIATQGESSLLPEVDVKGTYTLTSSSGDDVSYFDKDGRNTYFTGVLLEVLRKGIDNTNEMLALDDLYDYAHTHLQQKNFPHPISKSQLNIPPSQFFIARNPSFSLDKLKRRPAQLYSKGRLQDALYEYELLLQKYPGDLQLRKEAEQCRSQVLFSQLVHEGDELYYHDANYKSALDKYRKALHVKQDDMVLQKITKCEERLSNTHDSTGDLPDRHTPPEHRKSAEPIEKSKTPVHQHQGASKNPGLPPLVKQAQPEKIIQPLHQENQVISVSYFFTALALVWLLLLIGIYFVFGMPMRNWFYPSALALLVTSILVGVRLKKMTNPEMLLYAYASMLPIFYLATYLSRDDDTLLFIVPVSAIPAFLFFILLKSRVTSMSIVQFIFGSLALLLFWFYAGSALFFSISIVILEFSDKFSSTLAIIGAVLSVMAAIGITIRHFRKWRAGKNHITASN